MLKVWRTREGESGRAGGAFQFERLTVKVTRWRVVLGGVAVGAYALALIAMAPAEIIVARSSNGERQAVGTIWAGERAMPGGFGARWTVMPFSSIAHLSGALRFGLRGPDTAATGQALVRPGRVSISDLNGTGSMRLLNAAAPGLPFACSSVMRFDVARLTIKGTPESVGSIAVSPGDCAPTTGGPATPLPALTGSVRSDEADSTIVFARADSNAEVMKARVQADGGLTASVEAGGVGLLPGVGAPVSIETSL
ncbi:hypothetical protein [Brevundimonas sp. NIBR11]|uniref:hypothetical protein n=1 Tax=Brevundimonas sp. NIBR11 TaxID=3015999 RepID=UPI0022F12AFC|nr:hypothetical protein [Brevundimonas sp. NIBR11]WGM30525.1 hypothetical protein KKHFBJBL_00750 [Brevundimonas sp. NIBR11]